MGLVSLDAKKKGAWKEHSRDNRAEETGQACVDLHKNPGPPVLKAEAWEVNTREG